MNDSQNNSNQKPKAGHTHCIHHAIYLSLFQALKKSLSTMSWEQRATADYYNELKKAEGLSFS